MGAALAEMSQRFATAGQASRLPVSTLGAIGSALGGAGAAANTAQTQYLDQAIKLQALKRSLQQMGITDKAMNYVLEQWARQSDPSTTPGGASAAPAPPLRTQSISDWRRAASGRSGPWGGGPFALPNVPDYSGVFGPVATPAAAGIGGGDRGARARLQPLAFSVRWWRAACRPGGTADLRTGGDLCFQGGPAAVLRRLTSPAALVAGVGLGLGQPQTW